MPESKMCSAAALMEVVTLSAALLPENEVLFLGDCPPEGGRGNKAAAT